MFMVYCWSTVFWHTINLSILVAMAADSELDSSFSSSGVLENVEATPPPAINPPTVSQSGTTPVPVAQKTPLLQAPPPIMCKAPPLPVLKFPKVKRRRRT